MTTNLMQWWIPTEQEPQHAYLRLPIPHYVLEEPLKPPAEDSHGFPVIDLNDGTDSRVIIIEM